MLRLVPAIAKKRIECFQVLLIQPASTPACLCEELNSLKARVDDILRDEDISEVAFDDYAGYVFLLVLRSLP